jgi:hypothetical protein
MPLHAPIDCLGGCAIAAVVAITLGLILRGCGVRRAWVASGALAGALLGAQGLGRVDARLHERLFMGASAERREMFVAARAIEVASMAAMPRGAVVDDEDLAKLEAEHGAAELRFTRARRSFDEDAAWVVAALAAMTLVGASPMTGRLAWWREGGAPVGAWCVTAPAALITIALALSPQPQPEPWWMAAIAIACLGAPALHPRDRWTAVRLLGGRSPAIDAARGMNGACAIALALAAWSMADDESVAWLLPWAAALAAWGLRSTPAGTLVRMAGPMVAATAAIAMTRIDPLADWQPWIVLAVFCAEDLKWIGGAFGAWIWGRVPWFAALRACMPLADTGLAQAALGAVAILTAAVPTWLGYALIASAAVVELMEPVRRGTALRLDEAIQASRHAR